MRSRWTPSTRDAAHERGSGTVLGLATIGVLLSMLLALVMLSGAVVARQKAQNAADLGAVAGAQLFKTGGDAHAVCARVGRWVKANGGRLDECSVVPSNARMGDHDSGPQVTVTVHRTVGAWPRWVATVSAVAGLVPADR
ncbi:MAG: Rv3654c family TadE-like protein [Ornithinimicrobium sp.]